MVELPRLFDARPAGRILTRASAGLLVATCFCLASAPPISAQGWEGAAAVGLRVTDEDGQPIADAQVVARVSDADDLGPPPVATDAGGRAVVSGLRDGEWFIEVSHPRYMLFAAYINLKAGKKPVVGFSSQVNTATSWSPMTVKFQKASADFRRSAPKRAEPKPPTVVRETAPPPPPPEPKTVVRPEPEPPKVVRPEPEAEPTVEPEEAVTTTADEPGDESPEVPEVAVQPAVEDRPPVPEPPAEDAAAIEVEVAEIPRTDPEPAPAVEQPAPVPATPAPVPTVEPEPEMEPQPAPEDATPPDEVEEAATEAPTPVPEPVEPTEPPISEPVASTPPPAATLQAEPEQAELPDPEPVATPQEPTLTTEAAEVVDETAGTETALAEPMQEPQPMPSESQAPSVSAPVEADTAEVEDQEMDAPEPSKPEVEQPVQTPPIEPYVAEPTIAEPADTAVEIVEEVPIETPEPAPAPPKASERTVEPPSTADATTTPSPTAVARMPRFLRSAAAGTCAECQPGEWAVAAEQESARAGDTPRTSACTDEYLATAREGAQRLADAPGERLDGYVGPMLTAMFRLADSNARDEIQEQLASVTDPESNCQMAGIVLPRGTTFSGYVLEAWDNLGGRGCRAGMTCAVGKGRWLEEPEVVEGAERSVVYSIFKNRSTRRPRRLRMTIYFTPDTEDWAPRSR